MANNHDLQSLSKLLVAAADKLAARKGPIWSEYESGEEMAKFVLECRNAIDQGTMTLSQKRSLWTIFAPTCDWDDVVGDVDLGNDVFFLLDMLYRNEVVNDKTQPS